MFYPYNINQENGKYICRVRDLDFYSTGSTKEEAFSKMKDGLLYNIDIKYRKEGLMIPMPSLPIRGKDSLFYIGLKDEARFRLWNLLKQKNINTAEFGRVLGISRQQAHNMLSGAVSVSMEKYSEAFELLGYYLSLELNPYK